MDEKAFEMINDAATLSKKVAFSLYGLSAALEETGQEKLSNELMWLAVKCEHSAKLTRQGMGGITTAVVDQADQNSANLLAASMAGIAIATKGRSDG